MPKCPKCEADYMEGDPKCSSCGETIVGAAQTKDSPSGPCGGLLWSDLPSVIGQVFVRYWLMIVAGVLLTAMYWGLFQYFAVHWGEKQGYYSHGPLVPLISLFMIWANRKRMALMKIRASWLGLALIIPSIPLFVFGRWTSSAALWEASFLPMVVGAVLLLTGTRMTWLLLFPVLYLAFMIPLPATLLDSATFRVQLQSTTLASKILSLTYPIRQEGASIMSPDLPEPLLVGAPCSGFRLLISLLTFTGFFVYMVNDRKWKRLWELASSGALKFGLGLLGGIAGSVFLGTVGYLLGGKPAALVFAVAGVLLVELLPWKKWILIFLAFPLSLFINSLRISMIGYAGFWTGSAEAMHKFHDWSGYLGLVICFAILFGFARLIKADKFGIPDPDTGTPNAGPAPHSYGGPRRAVAVAILGLILVSNLLIAPLAVSAKGRLAREDLPVSFGSWTSQEVPVDKMALEMLKTGDMTQRVYVDNGHDGRQVVAFVEAAKDSEAFHDPHSCLPGGGSPISRDQTVILDVQKPRPMKIHASLLQATSEYGSSLVVYWYMTGEETCPTTPSMRQRMRTLQLHEFCDLLMHPNQRATIQKSMHDQQWHWYRFSMEVWSDAESDLPVLKDFIRDYVAHTAHFGE